MNGIKRTVIRVIYKVRNDPAGSLKQGPWLGWTDFMNIYKFFFIESIWIFYNYIIFVYYVNLTVFGFFVCDFFDFIDEI